ncbi:MAG: hypothetical protein JWP20_764, partial [Roseomonas sp.]|nr:hypothetical protein [Roseomonas sp.]
DANLAAVLALVVNVVAYTCEIASDGRAEHHARADLREGAGQVRGA